MANLQSRTPLGTPKCSLETPQRHCDWPFPKSFFSLRGRGGDGNGKDKVGWGPDSVSSNVTHLSFFQVTNISLLHTAGLSIIITFAETNEHFENQPSIFFFKSQQTLLLWPTQFRSTTITDQLATHDAPRSEETTACSEANIWQQSRASVLKDYEATDQQVHQLAFCSLDRSTNSPRTIS